MITIREFVNEDYVYGIRGGWEGEWDGPKNFQKMYDKLESSGWVIYSNRVITKKIKSIEFFLKFGRNSTKIISIYAKYKNDYRQIGGTYFSKNSNSVEYAQGISAGSDLTWYMKDSNIIDSLKKVEERYKIKWTDWGKTPSVKLNDITKV